MDIISHVMEHAFIALCEEIRRNYDSQESFMRAMKAAENVSQEFATEAALFGIECFLLSYNVQEHAPPNTDPAKFAVELFSLYRTLAVKADTEPKLDATVSVESLARSIWTISKVSLSTHKAATTVN